MNFERMKESLKTIKLLEKDLLRDLTEEEKEIVINEGWERFLFGPNYLNFTEEDYKDLKALKALVSAFYTQNEKEFEDLAKNCPIGAYCALKEIVRTIEESDKDCCDKCAAGKSNKNDFAEKSVCNNSPIEGFPEDFFPEDYTDLPWGNKDINKPEKEVQCSNPEHKSDATVAESTLDPQTREIAKFAQFTQDLYNSLKIDDKKWFNKLNDDIRKQLFDLFKKEKDTCTENELCGVMTDAVKDCVVEDYVTRLHNGETIEMTNDEYMEVADYLCEHEDHIFLSNENGKVRLITL